jgi:hypothetical protein
VWKLSGDAECILDTLEVDTVREVIIKRVGRKETGWRY